MKFQYLFYTFQQRIITSQLLIKLECKDKFKRNKNSCLTTNPISVLAQGTDFEIKSLETKL